jgi:hypothetical protein
MLGLVILNDVAVLVDGFNCLAACEKIVARGWQMSAALGSR